MIWNINKKHIILGCLFLGIVLMVGCDTILPSDFDKEEISDTMSAVDQQACTYLTSTEAPQPISVAVFGGGLDNLALDSLWVNAEDALIGELYDTLLTDTHMQIDNYTVDEGDTLYADTSFVMFIPSSGGDIYFYITWDLTEDNYDTYVDLDILDKAGTLLTAKESSIPLEVVSGSTQAVDIGGQVRYVSTIRARKVYGLSAGALYLVRFAVSEPENVGLFRMVILKD